MQARKLRSREHNGLHLVDQTTPKIPFRNKVTKKQNARAAYWASKYTGKCNWCGSVALYKFSLQEACKKHKDKIKVK